MVTERHGPGQTADDGLDKFDDASRKRRLQILTTDASLCIDAARNNYDEQGTDPDVPVAAALARWLDGVSRFAKREREYALRRAKDGDFSAANPFGAEREAEAIELLRNLCPRVQLRHSKRNAVISLGYWIKMPFSSGGG